MGTRWGVALVAVLWLGSGGAHAQDADAWVPAAEAPDDPTAVPDIDPAGVTPPPSTSSAEPPPASGPPPGGTSLGIRVTGRAPGLRVHLRPVDAAWGEPFVCAIPCTALVGPGDWAVSLGRRRDVTPLAVNGSPLSLLASGRLDVRFSDRGAARAAGVVLLVLGGLALVGALIGALTVSDAPSFGAALNRAILVLPAAVGGVLVIAGLVLVGLQPWASARWTPDP